MYSLVIIAILLTFSSFDAIGQDERLFRKLITPKNDAISQEKMDKKYKWVVTSKQFKIDLNGDGVSETFHVEKRDGETWIEFFKLNAHHKFGFSSEEFKREKFKSFKFETLGLRSELTKISVRKIAPNIKVLLLHFYEGLTSYLGFLGSSRLYILTLENGDLDQLKLSRGPVKMEEKEQRSGHYHQRELQVSVFDYNKDGIREISLKHHKTQRVLHYKGKGRWVEI